VAEQYLTEIAALFAAHGVPTTLRGEYLVPSSAPGPAIRAAFTPVESRPNGASARLDVEFTVSDRYVPVESFAGLGTSAEDAAKSALDNFCRSSLHVALAALYGQVDLDQVAIERWQLSGSQYEAILGNYLNKSFGGVEVRVPEQVFPCLEALIRALPGDEALYWVRMFYCNINANDRVTEVLLNNEEWPEAQTEIAGLPWTPSASYYSIRLFLMLKRVPAS
jgi:Family of unknown function (DUF6348)